MVAVGENTKFLLVTFTDNKEPQFEFHGDWNIKDLGHARVGLFRAYKHYMKGVRHERAG